MQMGDRAGVAGNGRSQLLPEHSFSLRMPPPCHFLSQSGSLMRQTGNLYADLSGYYDHFCAEVDYAAQCAFALRAFQCFAESGGRDYLDLACGTGSHLLYMQQQGFAVNGLDNSPEMLAQAQARCPGAELLLCDLAAFEQVESFDLITCFLYSIHYSHPLAALAETLRRAWQALKRGGVLIFNAVDCRGIRNDRGITTRLRNGDDLLSFQSGWYYGGEGEVLDLKLVITRDSRSASQVWHDHHTMTAMTLPQMKDLLETTGFAVTMLEHDYNLMQQWQGESYNAIFVACKR